MGYQAEIGILKTSFGFNIGFSNKNFNQLDPTFFIKRPKKDEFWEKMCEFFYFDMNINLSGICWNTYLQGYPFENENASTIEYTLSNDRIKRLTLNSTISLGVKMYKTTFYYQNTIYSPEYDTGRWHNFGTIGLNFEIFD